MSPEDSVEIDPAVLEDPLGGSDAPATTEPAAKTEALVPSPGKDLAPYDPFRRYMAELRRYPPLDREQERELARRYRDTGDREALFRLISANLMLVVRVAFSFRRAARNLLDLIQEGNVGLLQAVERFDPELGVRLPTYAAWWVRAYMVKFLLDNVRLVRVGTTNARRKLLRNLRQEKEKLAERGFDVNPKLLAETFGVSEQDVRDVEMALESRDLSLDAPSRDDEGPSHAELLPDSGAAALDDDVARRQLQERTEEALERFRSDLTERELALLDERILSEDPLTLQAIGERFGTSREAVRQAESRLMKRLSEFLKGELGDLGQIRIGPD